MNIPGKTPSPDRQRRMALTMDDSSSGASDSQRFRPLRIVSGGQTGVDRAALDVAMEMGIEHGGWCPRGRLAEDGHVPDRYLLRETASVDYAVRTEQNVIDSAATLVLFWNRLSGGSRLTVTLADRHERPCLAVDLDTADFEAELGRARMWLNDCRPETLNIAGPRESNVAGVRAAAKRFLRFLFGVGDS